MLHDAAPCACAIEPRCCKTKQGQGAKPRANAAATRPHWTSFFETGVAMTTMMNSSRSALVGRLEGEVAMAEKKTGVPQPGSDILVECLLRQGVDTIFAYPGGASM